MDPKNSYPFARFSTRKLCYKSQLLRLHSLLKQKVSLQCRLITADNTNRRTWSSHKVRQLTATLSSILAQRWTIAVPTSVYTRYSHHIVASCCDIFRGIEQNLSEGARILLHLAPPPGGAVSQGGLGAFPPPPRRILKYYVCILGSSATRIYWLAISKKCNFSSLSFYCCLNILSIHVATWHGGGWVKREL